MLKLQRFMRGCFANAALVFFAVSIPIVPALFRTSLPHARARFFTEPPWMQGLGILLIVLQYLILLMPPIVAVVNAVAWWKLKNAERGARGWALAASISFLLLSAPLFAADFVLFSHAQARRGGTGVVILSLILLSVGIAGLIAFWKRGISIASGRLPKVAGDGTHKSLDALVAVLQLVGLIGGMNLYMRWGHEQHLPLARGLEVWVQLVVVILAVVLIHESAHAVVGLGLGMKLQAFIVGPFEWTRREGRWRFKFRPSQAIALTGATGLVQVDPNQSSGNEIAMIAAGPISNLFTGVVAGAMAYSALDYAWWPFWEYFALFATVSLIAFVTNLIPFRPDDAYSDGALIYQILHGGPMAAYRRIVNSVSSTVVSERRPRDYDVATMERIYGDFTIGRRALLLRLWTSSCYLDRGDFAKASSALAEAERIFFEAAPDASGALLTGFLIKGAILGRDRAYFQKWWQLIEGKKPENPNQDFWLAKCAFYMAESNLAVAREAFNIGQDYLARLPRTGTYNYDRDCYARIKEILDRMPSERGTESRQQAEPFTSRSEMLTSAVSS
jgi:hypothetical protein